MTDKDIESFVDAFAPVIQQKIEASISAAVSPLRERIAFLEGQSGHALAEGADGAMKWTPSVVRQ